MKWFVSVIDKYRQTFYRINLKSVFIVKCDHSIRYTSGNGNTGIDKYLITDERGLHFTLITTAALAGSCGFGYEFFFFKW